MREVISVTTLRDLNRYLSLEAFLRMRRDTDKQHHLTRADVENDGREVKVSEHDGSVVDPDEQ